MIFYVYNSKKGRDQMPTIDSEVQVFPPEDGVKRPGVIKVSLRTIREDDGSTREQYVWKKGESVAVFVVCGDKFLVKREYKYGVMDEVVTCAAGGVDNGQTPEDAACQEVLEEFGREVTGLTPLSVGLVNMPDKTTERQHLFIAYVRESQIQTPEAGEQYSVALIEGRRFLKKEPKMTSIIQRLLVYEALEHLGY